MTQSTEHPHSLRTRLFHLSIAVLVIAQVATSRFMVTPGQNREENLLFEIHEYTGIAAFFLIFGFWSYSLLRTRGTAPGLLFPWFSRDRLRALVADTRLHFQALLRRKIPEHVRNAPLPSAVHGLGILLIAAMATTCVTWFVGIQLGDMAQSWAKAAKEVHEALSNLVWIYLIGHAGIALINQLTGKQPLSDMWSVSKQG